MNEALDETQHETRPASQAIALGLRSGLPASQPLARWRLRWGLCGLLLMLGLALVPFPWHGIWWIQPKFLSHPYALPVPSIFLFIALLVSTVTATIAISWTTFWT